MFNKGMLYHNYGDKFIRILDLQAAGQIPALILDTNSWGCGQYIHLGLRQLVRRVKDERPTAFGEWVDWEAVIANGCKGSYFDQAQQQAKLHPKPEALPQFMGEPAVPKGVFQIWPGQAAKVYERLKTVQKATAKA